MAIVLPEPETQVAIIESERERPLTWHELGRRAKGEIRLENLSPSSVRLEDATSCGDWAVGDVV